MFTKHKGLARFGAARRLKLLYLNMLFSLSVVLPVSAFIQGSNFDLAELDMEDQGKVQPYSYGQDAIATKFRLVPRSYVARTPSSLRREIVLHSSNGQASDTDTGSMSPTDASIDMPAFPVAIATPSPVHVLTCREAYDQPFGAANSTAHCQTIRSSCGGTSSLVNYTVWMGCMNPEWKWVGVLLVSGELLMLISLLATTADYFFVPALCVIARALRLSPSVAGITLVAFGNGAPDVFTAYAALHGQGDINMQIGGLFGATLFVTTIGLALVLVQSSEVPPYIGHYDVEQTRLLDDASGTEADGEAEETHGKRLRRGILGVSLGSFSRDVLTYLAGLSALMVMGINGRVPLVEGVILLCVYGVYVLVVVTSDWFRQSRRSRRMAKQLIQQRLSVSLRRNSLFSEHSLVSRSMDDLGSYIRVGLWDTSPHADGLSGGDREGLDGIGSAISGGDDYRRLTSDRATDMLIGQLVGPANTAAGRGLGQNHPDLTGNDDHVVAERYASYPMARHQTRGSSLTYPRVRAGQAGAPSSPSDLIRFTDCSVPRSDLGGDTDSDTLLSSANTRYHRGLLKSQASAPDAVTTAQPHRQNYGIEGHTLGETHHPTESAGMGIEMELESALSPLRPRNDNDHPNRRSGRQYSFPHKHIRVRGEKSSDSSAVMSNSSDSSDFSQVDIQADDVRQISGATSTSPLARQHFDLPTTDGQLCENGLMSDVNHELEQVATDLTRVSADATDACDSSDKQVDKILKSHSAKSENVQLNSASKEGDSVPATRTDTLAQEKDLSKLVINFSSRQDSDPQSATITARTRPSIPIIRLESPDTSDPYNKPRYENRKQSLYAEDVDTLVRITVSTPNTPTPTRHSTALAADSSASVLRAQSVGPHRPATSDTTTRAVLDIREDDDGMGESRTPQRVMSPIMMGKALERGLSSAWTGPFVESFVQLPGICWPNLEAPNYERVQLMLEMPFTLVRWLSIPYCDFQDDETEGVSDARPTSPDTCRAGTHAYERMNGGDGDSINSGSDSDASERVVFVDDEQNEEYQKWNRAKQVLSYISPTGMSVIVGLASFGPEGLISTKLLGVIPAGVACVCVGTVISAWLYVANRRRRETTECQCESSNSTGGIGADVRHHSRSVPQPHNPSHDSNLLSVPGGPSSYTGPVRESRSAKASPQDGHVCMYPSPPPTHINTVLSLLGFVSSVAWISLIGNEVVAILTALGLTLKLSTSILSLSVLAIGNSTGDLVSALAVARKGLYSMALGAIFGGPLFHDCVGLGVSLVSACLASPNYVYYFQVNSQSCIATLFVAVSMVSSLLAVPLLRHYHTKLMAYAIYLVCLYLLFIAIIAYTAFE